MKSIRRTLILRLVVGLETLAILAGVIFFLFMQRALVREFDATTLSKAKALAGMFEIEENGQMEFNYDPDLLPEFNREKNGENFQVAFAQGRVIARSKSLGSKKIALPNDFKLGFFEHALRDRRPGRGVVVEHTPMIGADHEPDEGAANVQNGKAPVLWIAVARSSEQLDLTLHIIAVGCLLACLALPLAIIALVGWNVRAGLRPLDQVAQAASQIDAKTLWHRFDAQTMPIELQPICDKLNGLLANLGEAFERERRFNRNVAHELRTPIAELRAISEVALMETDLDATARAALQEALAIAAQMEGMVNSLILLAQSEVGGNAAGVEEVELSYAVAKARAALRDPAAQERIVLREMPGAAVQTNEALLQIVLGNLIANGLEYSPPETPVHVSMEARGDRMALAVQNENSELQAEDVAHLFDPFWRKDASRSGNKHAGLGLSIAAAICKALGIDLQAAKDADTISVSLLFPTAVVAEADSHA